MGEDDAPAERRARRDPFDPEQSWTVARSNGKQIRNQRSSGKRLRTRYRDALGESANQSLQDSVAAAAAARDSEAALRMVESITNLEARSGQQVVTVRLTNPGYESLRSDEAVREEARQTALALKNAARSEEYEHLTLLAGEAAHLAEKGKAWNRALVLVGAVLVALIFVLFGAVIFGSLAGLSMPVGDILLVTAGAGALVAAALLVAGAVASVRLDRQIHEVRAQVAYREHQREEAEASAALREHPRLASARA